MKTVKQQAGMSFLGIAVIAIMIGFFVVAGLAMAPSYMEHMTIRKVMEDIVNSPDAENNSTAAMRKRISRAFDTNRIDGMKASDVVLSRKDGRLHVNANYESRVHIMFNIDAVMVFDDLQYTVGN